MTTKNSSKHLPIKYFHGHPRLARHPRGFEKLPKLHKVAHGIDFRVSRLGAQCDVEALLQAALMHQHVSSTTQYAALRPQNTPAAK